MPRKSRSEVEKTGARTGSRMPSILDWMYLQRNRRGTRTKSRAKVKRSLPTSDQRRMADISRKTERINQILIGMERTGRGEAPPVINRVRVSLESINNLEVKLAASAALLNLVWYNRNGDTLTRGADVILSYKMQGGEDGERAVWLAIKTMSYNGNKNNRILEALETESVRNDIIAEATKNNSVSYATARHIVYKYMAHVGIKKPEAEKRE
jgi:hypothetical protein